jgi:RHS repeat-associated protein
LLPILWQFYTWSSPCFTEEIIHGAIKSRRLRWGSKAAVRYINVIVSTSIVKNGSSTDGNIAAVVVVRVDASPVYGNDPGKPGYGTIVAVITDGARLFGTSIQPATYSGYFFRHLATPRTQIASLTQLDLASFFSLGTPTARVTSVLHPAPLTVASGTKRYSFYTPEMHLLAETALTTSGTPATAYEYIWFNGRPVAQIDAGAATHWTFTDHLGTPILLTNTDATTYWRAEYEPFGAVYALRSADVRQPLRLPGQEAEQLNLGANGVTEREYNIFRWYRGAWGRYTQGDPFELAGGLNLYAYVADNPIEFTDPLGLDTVGCDSFNWRVETPCQLECCAKHDKCFDDNHCSSGSWPGATPKCGCDKTKGCQKCDSDAKACVLGNCNRFNDPSGKDSHPSEPKFYCGKQHRFVRIPGDFPNREAAEPACEYDYSKDCKIPLRKANRPWWKKVFP